MVQPWAHMAKRRPGPSAADRGVTDPILSFSGPSASVVKGSDTKGVATGRGRWVVRGALLGVAEPYLVSEP